MPTLQEMLRLKGIFNPATFNTPPITPNPPMDMGPSIGPIQQPMQQPIQQPYDAGNRMSELYHPETQATDLYNQTISEYPNKQDYHPSMLRRIGSAISAFGPGGMQQGMEFLDRPYTEKLTDWKNKLVPQKSAADLERYSNTNERSLAYQTVSSELKDRSEQNKNKVNADKAELAKLKAMKGNFSFDYKGPKVIVSNKDTGETRVTDINTGSLSDSDTMDRKQEDVLEQIGVKGKQATALEEQKQTGRETVQDTRGWGQPMEITDPNDPTKKIAVSIHAATGEVKRILMDNKQVTGLQKPGVAGKNNNNLDPIKLKHIQEKTQETLDALDEMMDDKGKLKPEMLMGIGKSRYLQAQNIYGTEARAGESKINRLKSLLIIDLIKEMKDQSRTGATGFGQLNMKELAVLETAASRLDPSLSEEEFAKELGRIKEKLKKILQPEDGFTPVTTTKKPTVDELMKKYGGEL